MSNIYESGKSAQIDTSSGLHETSNSERLLPRDYQFENLTKYQVWQTRCELGIYPPDNPVSRFANTMMESIQEKGDETKYTVLVYKSNQDNAIVFPNGMIFLSDEAIPTGEVEQGVQFVLKHEEQHVKWGHARKELASGRRSMNPLRDMGEGRFYELLQADVGAVLALDELGINPYGSVVFFENMRHKKRQSHTARYGRGRDRPVNLITATLFADMPSLIKPLIPIENQVLETIRTEKSANNYQSKTQALSESIEKRSRLAFKTAVSELDFDTGFYAFPYLLEKQDWIERVVSASALYWKDIQGEELRRIAQGLFLGMEAVTKDKKLSPKQQIFFYYSALDLIRGANATSQDNQERLFQATNGDVSQKEWRRERYGFYESLDSLEDVEALLSVLELDVLDSIDLPLMQDPNNFINNIVDQVLLHGIYEKDGVLDVPKYTEFVCRFADKMGKLYSVKGVDFFSAAGLGNRIFTASEKLLEPFEKDVLRNEVMLQRPELIELFIKKDSKNLTPVEALIALQQDIYELPDHTEQVTLTPEKSTRLMNVLASSLPETGNVKDIYSFLLSYKNELQNRDLIIEDRSIHNEWRRNVVNALYDHPKVKQLGLTRFQETEFKILSDIILNETGEDPYSLVEVQYFLRLNKFSLEEYKRLRAICTQPNKVLADLGIVTSFELPGGLDEYADPVQSASLELDFQQGFYSYMERLLRKKNLSHEEFSRDLEALSNIYLHSHTDIISDIGEKIRRQMKRISGTETVEDPEVIKKIKMKKQKDKIIEAALSRFPYDLQNKTHLKDLYYLSTMIDGTNLSTRLQALTWQGLNERLDFHEGLAMISNEAESKRMLSLQSIKTFVDTHANSHEEIAEARKTLFAFLTSSDRFEDGGKMIVGEYLAKYLFSDKLELFKALLGNGKDDSMSKKYLYNRWLQIYAADKSLAKFVDMQTVSEQIYRADSQVKFVLIRDILLGEDGILAEGNEEKRRELIKFFLDNYVSVSSESDQSKLEEIRKIAYKFMDKVDYKIIYLTLSSLLEDRILLPAQRIVPWEVIIKEEEVDTTLFGAAKIFPQESYQDDPDYFPFNGEAEYQERPGYPFASPELESSKDRNIDYTYSDEDEVEAVLKAKQLETQQGYINKRVEPKLQKPTEQQAERILKLLAPSTLKTKKSSYEDLVLEILETNESGEESKPMTVDELIFKIAQTNLFLIRMGQSLEMYVDEGEKISSVSQRIYDDNEGQPKITAEDTMLREYREVVEETDGLGEKLGAGAITDVWASTIKATGEKIVTKIIAPNAEFNTNQMHSELQKVFMSLAEEDSRYEPILVLLDHIREWILGDINYEGYLAQNSLFKQQNDGFNVGGRYQIYVPRARGPESKRFLREERIYGYNLTQSDLLKREGHDLREVARLVSSSIYHQIGQGLFHANIHPGNLRLKANTLSLLDRSFLRPITSKDMQYFFSLPQLVSDPNALVEQSLLYFNSNADSNVQKALHRELDGLNWGSDLVGNLKRMSVVFHKYGIIKALIVPLLLQNIKFADNFAKQQGYASIVESLTATS